MNESYGGARDPVHGSIGEKMRRIVGFSYSVDSAAAAASSDDQLAGTEEKNSGKQNLNLSKRSFATSSKTLAGDGTSDDESLR